MTERELDRAVAEKVMGWTAKGAHFYEGKKLLSYQDYTDSPDCVRFMPSSDPAMMLLVIERMKAFGWFIEIKNFADTWHVSFMKDPNADAPFASHSEYESLPKAVCLAALKALHTQFIGEGVLQ